RLLLSAPNGDGRLVLFGWEASFLTALFSKIEANPPPRIPAGGVFVFGGRSLPMHRECLFGSRNSSPEGALIVGRSPRGGAITCVRLRLRASTYYAKPPPDLRRRYSRMW